MSPDPITRRTALKYAGIMALAARGGVNLPGYAAPAAAKGYGTDPNLLTRPVTWPKTLQSGALQSLTALCDIILPAESPHPSAAGVGVQDFLDEWLSAPYPQMQADRALILEGLEGLDKAVHDAHRTSFNQVNPAAQIALFDTLCAGQNTQPFARRLIELVCAGYYTTREGHAAIGYVGNVALEHFPAPTPEIVRHLHNALAALPSPRKIL